MQDNVHEAKSQLSRLLELVEEGETVVIARPKMRRNCLQYLALQPPTPGPHERSEPCSRATGKLGSPKRAEFRLECYSV
jgi:hypothetical protein